MLHNIDTLGAALDPGCLGLHIQSGADLSFEVICRRLDDRGGGLARVDGRVRLVEGLAMPREDDEFQLTWYNSLTTWIDIDRLLSIFGLSRESLENQDRVDAAIRELARRLPTYITLKDVKKRWGNGQEDVFPVSQFEKLWGDMTALAEVDCQFIVVPTLRGQQLKEQAQLDGCSSTEKIKITANEDYNLLAVNAFNPQSRDERNAKFMPYALTIRDVRFELIVIDPDNGGIVFKTKDAQNAWDGTDQRNGQMVPAQKAYIWKVVLQDALPSEKTTYSGTIVRI